jgi:hypothetical protein
MSDEQPQATWSYQPGDWFGIFGPDLTLLLPGAEKSRVTGLWELVDGGAGFDQVLDGLLSSGLSALAGFVLIGSAAGPTRILLRGGGVRAAVLTGDGAVALEGTETATWSERSFEGVTSLTVAVDPPAGESRHFPIERGLVRVSRIDRPEHSTALDDADTHVEPPAYAAEPAEPVELVTVAFDAVDADPVADQEEAAGEALGEPPPPLRSIGSWTADGDVRAPTLPPPPPLPPLPPTPPPPPLAPAPVVAGQPRSAGLTRSVATLLISNGQSVDVDRVVLIGRAPEARRFTSTEQPRLVTVPSPLQEISSTHVEVRPGAGADHGSAVVTDLGSTNGTVLVQPGLGPEELQTGTAVRLVPGAVINLGDGVTIQVSRP